jgi:hypothetical protein
VTETGCAGREGAQGWAPQRPGTKEQQLCWTGAPSVQPEPKMPFAEGRQRQSPAGHPGLAQIQAAELHAGQLAQALPRARAAEGAPGSRQRAEMCLMPDTVPPRARRAGMAETFAHSAPLHRALLGRPRGSAQTKRLGRKPCRTTSSSLCLQAGTGFSGSSALARSRSAG